MYDRIKTSKEVRLAKIGDLINDEYEIDRSSILNQIIAEKEKYIIVAGEPGSGKSALCKKLLFDKERVLFVRADELRNLRTVDDIWEFNLNTAFAYLNDGKPLYIYIDALEYIENAGEPIKSLLETILLEANCFCNIYIIMSCRTCDIDAFIKIIGKYNIKEYIVPLLSQEELSMISAKYPAIAKISKQDRYKDLLHSPFYINLVVSKNININKLDNINEFREYIWSECICLKSKAIEENIDTALVVKTVKKIVFDRAKRNALGIRKDEIDGRIATFLRSNGVLSEDQKYLRLKYDIYEDICFEDYFDNEFDACRGVLGDFFEHVELMGDCAYRRYQIWVSHKLLAKENRDKYIYNLVFDSEAPDDWRKNTEIGIVRSEYSSSFFEENRDRIIDDGIINELISIVNCYAFELQGCFEDDEKTYVYSQLKAIGKGRDSLIKIIYSDDYYKCEKGCSFSNVKICVDYAQVEDKNPTVAQNACVVIAYYIEKQIEETSQFAYIKIMDMVSKHMSALFKLVPYSSKYLLGLWKRMRGNYGSDNDHSARVASDILEWTLDHVTVQLIDEMPQELITIANTLWVNNNEVNNDDDYIYHYDDTDLQWGLSKIVRDYHYKKRDANSDLFLRLLFKRQPIYGLLWSIELINNAVSQYASNNPQNVEQITLYIPEKDEYKQYIGNVDMWLAGTMEYTSVPTILGDIIYWLKNTIIYMLVNYEEDKILCATIIQKIKNYIIQKSNNIMLLSIVEAVGLYFLTEHPGICIELFSSLELIYYDIQRVIFVLTRPRVDIVKSIDQITYTSSGINRYMIDTRYTINIQEYAFRTQLFADEKCTENCYKILDRLYSQVDKEKNPSQYLQIEKMDSRGALYKNVGENLIAIEPKLSDETHKIVEDHENKNKPLNDLETTVNNIERQSEEHTIDYLFIQNAIDKAQRLIDGQEPAFGIHAHNAISKLILVALTKSNISRTDRSKVSAMWVDMLEAQLFRNKAILADNDNISVLFNQLFEDIDDTSRNKIYLFTIEVFQYQGNSGLVDKVRNILEKELSNHQDLAMKFFTVLLLLGKDEYAHKIHNIKQIELLKKRDIHAVYSFSQDEYIESVGGEKYNTQKEEIISEYLYSNKTINVLQLDLSAVDKDFLFNAMNIGLGLENDIFYKIVRKTIPIVMESLDQKKRNTITDHYSSRVEFRKMLWKQLSRQDDIPEKIIDMLFGVVNVNSFNSDMAEYYVKIFIIYPRLFFYSASDPRMREKSKAMIRYLEKKVERIESYRVRYKLEKILVFADAQIKSDIKYNPDYSYDDKKHIMHYFQKYGEDHFNDMVEAIYQLHSMQLLPELLTPLSEIVKSLEEKNRFISVALNDRENSEFFKTVILQAYIHYFDDIKRNKELTEAFENVLSTMVKHDNEYAAVVLDGFRMH